jgi:hypothetical protein
MSAGSTLLALLIGASVLAFGIPIGPRSWRALREQPPSPRMSLLRLLLRLTSGMVFVVAALGFNSAMHAARWVSVVEVVGMAVGLSGEVARYKVAQRLRVGIADRPTSHESR